jgi:hypothetical protein
VKTRNETTTYLKEIYYSTKRLRQGQPPSKFRKSYSTMKETSIPPSSPLSSSPPPQYYAISKTDAPERAHS